MPHRADCKEQTMQRAQTVAEGTSTRTNQVIEILDDMHIITVEYVTERYRFKISKVSKIQTVFKKQNCRFMLYLACAHGQAV